MTNYEKIKAMDIDELANFFQSDCTLCVCFYKPGCCSLSCKEGVKQWFESEAEDNGTV